MRIIGNDPSTPRQAQIVASGTLSTGDTVVVNADGTVSIIEETPFAQDLGGVVTFAAADTEWTSAVYDESSQKVVIAFTDRGNSSHGTAVVGTVSGDSISFGTEVVFQTSSTSNISTAYDATNQKIVIAYENAGGSNFGTVVVGTVSGTSISFGTPVVFNSGSTQASDGIKTAHDPVAGKSVIFYTDLAAVNDPNKALVGTVGGTSISFGSPVTFAANGHGHLSAVYDPDSQNIVVAYRGDNPFYGTAIVGTVSGDVISFGSPVTFNSSSTRRTEIAYDTVNKKVVIAYSDLGNSDFGTAVVGTVTGTSLTFGTPVVFESASIGNGENLGATTAYHAASGSVVISYPDIGNSIRGTLIVGTVSGTSISFGTPVVFDTGDIYYPSSAYDPVQKKVVISWQNEPSNAGRAIVFNPQYDVTNLTAENYIGTAATGAADAQRAKINLKGAVDENQSGLTAGQSYFVQTDGTLGTTAGDPSVFAGTAVSATKLIVKG